MYLKKMHNINQQVLRYKARVQIEIFQIANYNHELWAKQKHS